MKHGSWLEKISGCLALVSLALVVSGTKACQEDYDLGSQSNLNNTPVSTETAVATATDEGDGIVTRTRTPVAGATDTPESDTTGTPTITPTIDTSAISLIDQSSGFLTELSLLGTVAPPQDDGKMKAAASEKSLNWLGDNFSKGDNSGSDGEHDNTDSDGDGYSDWLEEKMGSNISNPSAIPDLSTSTRLSERLRGIDDDKDGLPNDEEKELGTDPNSSDTNGDGKSDGASVLSGGSPLSANDTYVDTDEDGLSDALEESRGSSPALADTDSDGLSDSMEMAIGSNPINPDSDNDGISDGREYMLGSDPTRPESWGR